MTFAHPLRRHLLALPLAATAQSISCAHASDKLFLYTWTDYTAPALLDKFERETGIGVTVDTFDTNETLLAKLAAGAGGYDVVVTSSDFVPILAGRGLLRPIEAKTLTGFANIEARWRGPAWDPANTYTIPFGWGATGYAIDTRVVPGNPDSLKTLFEPPPEARGKVGMFGAPTEVVSLAELYLGISPCQTDPSAIKRVAALLEAQAPEVRAYASSGVPERIASGETAIQQTWNGDAGRARAANPAIRFVFPKEGVVGWMDNFAVPKDAPHPENARRFLEFMLRPENSALSADFTHAMSPIVGAASLTGSSLQHSPEMRLPDDLKVVFSPPCPAPALKLIDRVWTRLRR